MGLSLRPRLDRNFEYPSEELNPFFPADYTGGVTFPLESINPEDFDGSTQACVICHSSGNTTTRASPTARSASAAMATMPILTRT